MRIAVFTTIAGRGGAPAAMRRLVKGLKARGHRVDIFCLEDAPGDPEVLTVRRIPLEAANADLVEALQEISREEAIGNNRTSLSNTLFSLPLTGYRLPEVGSLAAYDAINIHWVAQFLSIGAIAEIAALGRPTLFTLHDMLSFTGGCHYSAGCRGFAGDCAKCPQLAEDLLGLPAIMLAAKRRLRRHANLAAVAPSRWMRDCAAASGVFAPDRCFHIDNAIEADVYRPFDRAEAKASLGIAPQARTILFGADNNLEQRKGFRHLIEMLGALRAMPAMEALRQDGRIQILAFGLGSPDLEDAGFPVRHLGHIRDDLGMARAYSAADVFVLPSLEDNQPNVMLEAMACGAPVVSFAVGGMRETIADGVTGRLIAPYDTGALAHALAELVDSPEALARMGAAAREVMASDYTLDRQAGLYESLIETIGRQNARSAEGAGAIAPMPGLPDGLSVRLGVDDTVVTEELASALALRIQIHYQRKVLAQLESDYQARLENRESTIRQLEADLRARELQIGKLQASLREHDESIQRLNAEVFVLGEIERLGEEALNDVLGSTSWRITRGLRRWLGMTDPAPAQGGAANRTLDNLGRVIAIRASTSWDVAAPLRLAQRAWRCLARALGRPAPPP